MRGHNTTGGYYQSYVRRLGTLDALHKKSCRIGPGLSELPRINLMRLYEKSSNTSEPPTHEADHGSVHQRLPARTRPLVVFAHPPVVVDPSDRSLHNPATRQHHEAFRGQQSLPIHGHALFGPFPCPPHQHHLGGGLFRTLHQIHAPAQGFLYPVRPLVLSAVTRIQPQMREAGKALVRLAQQRLDALVVHDLGAVDLRLESTKPSVSTRMWRLRPLTFLPPSKPRCSPPTAVLFTDWLSTTPALG